jgi:hypothetical protein
VNALARDNRHWHLNADVDGNFWSWASSVSTFAAAFVVLLLLVAFPGRRIALALLFASLAFVSLDDVVGLHERIVHEWLDPRLSDAFDVDISSRVLWPVVYSPILALTAWYLWRIGRYASARTCVRVAVAMLATALAVEALGAIIDRAGGQESHYRLAAGQVALEESLELGAWVLVAAGLAAEFAAAVGVRAGRGEERVVRAKPAPARPTEAKAS